MGRGNLIVKLKAEIIGERGPERQRVKGVSAIYYWHGLLSVPYILLECLNWVRLRI